MLNNIIGLPSNDFHFEHTKLTIDRIQLIDNGSDFLVFLLVIKVCSPEEVNMDLHQVSVGQSSICTVSIHPRG